MSAESGYGAQPAPDETRLSDLTTAAVTGTTTVNNAPIMDKRAPRFSWTPAYESTFFRSLCESVTLGLRENHSFKPEAWDRAAAALRDKHGAFPTKAHLVNKSDNARKKFRLWRGLREHPEFLYNPVTKSVTASEEVWKEHIEKEPLSRSLRGRPFEHEDYMEILYPDVIGSGGAPKRIMKPRRKGLDTAATNEDFDTPGTAVIDLARDNFTNPPAPVSNSAAVPQPSIPPQDNPITRRGPGRPSGGRQSGAGSALTPPDEATSGTAHGNSRKRLAPEAPFQSNKTRRNPAGFGLSHYSAPSNHSDVSHALEETLSVLADTLKGSRSNQRWPEQAIDIFFREFADEDMDFQLKMAEKALTDENKAMVFVKMPTAVRKHYIMRMREAFIRSGGVINSVGNVAVTM